MFQGGILGRTIHNADPLVEGQMFYVMNTSEVLGDPGYIETPGFGTPRILDMAVEHSASEHALMGFILVSNGMSNALDNDYLNLFEIGIQVMKYVFLKSSHISIK